MDVISARNRPELRMAWRGPSLLMLDEEGRSGSGDFQGWFFRQARFLHELRFEVQGEAPFVSSIAQTRPNEIAATYIHPPVTGTGGQKKKDGVLTRGVDLYARFRVRPASIEIIVEATSRWQERIELDFAWAVSADFATLHASQAGERKQEAEVAVEPRTGGVSFRYLHDELPFECSVDAEGGESQWTFAGGRLSATVALERQKTQTLRLIARAHDAEDPIDEAGEEARERTLEEWLRSVSTLHAPGDAPLATLVNEHVRALGSMAQLEGKQEDWMAPMAGFPLYPSYWVRDAASAGWQAGMWDQGKLIEATLPTARRLQGDHHDPYRAEEPGRIIRQHRRDPLTRIGKKPFGRFYADFSSPMVFIMSLGNAFAWSGEIASLSRNWDAVRRVLDWARGCAEEHSGFLAYKNPSEAGPPHEGWKDSGNAVVDGEGRQVDPPIAPVEVQGYWYTSLQFAAVMAFLVGSRSDAVGYLREAIDLKERFNRAFWMNEEGTFAFALGPDGEQVKAVVSNPGQALTAGIVEEDKIPRLIRRLFEADMFSGWGIRTLSSRNAAFNPQSYHLGSVWAVENGTILLGLRRYGFDDRVHQLARALFDLTRIWDTGLVPEAVGGYDRHTHPFPGAYPRANTLQAWNASQLPLVVQAMLGLRGAGLIETLAIDPVLPAWAPELTLRNLRLGKAKATIRFWREPDGTSQYEVLEQEGTIHFVRTPPLDALGVGPWDRLKMLVADLLPRGAG